jgi:hypothetical protein
MSSVRTIATFSVLCALSACAEPLDGAVDDAGGLEAAPLTSSRTSGTIAALTADEPADERAALAPMAAPTIDAIRVEGDCAAAPVIAGGGAQGEVRFTQFAARLDGTVAEASSTCDVHLSIRAGEGESFALEELSAEGMLSLAADVSARIEASYRIGASAGALTRAQIFRGPVSGPLVFFADFLGEDRTFSPCLAAGDLSVRLKLSATSHAQPGEASIALTRFRPLRIGLRACAPGSASAGTRAP